MKVAQVAKPNAPLETVARASDVVAVLGNSGLGHLAVGPEENLHGRSKIRAVLDGDYGVLAYDTFFSEKLL